MVLTIETIDRDPIQAVVAALSMTKMFVGSSTEEVKRVLTKINPEKVNDDIAAIYKV